jgi:hypothetical protein
LRLRLEADQSEEILGRLWRAGSQEREGDVLGGVEVGQQVGPWKT